MLAFGDSPRNFFNVISRLGNLIQNLGTYQALNLPTFVNANELNSQLENEPDIQSLVGGNYLNMLDSPSDMGGFCQNLASQIINRYIFRDNPRPNQTLQSANTSASLVELLIQMQTAGVTVLSMTVGNTNINFTGRGNSVVTSSIKRPFDGLQLDNSFQEKLTFTCTNDSYVGNAIAGNESIAVTGAGANSNLFSFNWPLGSGCAISINNIDGSKNNSSGNLLTNSGFETFTGNTPNNFTFDVGTGGTNVFKETTITYDPPPNFALRIVGDGVTPIQFRQKFNNSSGTPGKLTALNQYSFNIFMRRDATALGAGAMEVSLVDDGDVYLQDILGRDQKTTFNLATGSNTLTTSYLPLSCTFMTGTSLPTNQYLKIKFSTPSDKTIYLDKMSLGVMSQTYISGPFVASHAGSIPLQTGDLGFCNITNSRGAGGSLNNFQTLFARLFSNDFLFGGLLLPNSSVPFISDNLITRV